MYKRIVKRLLDFIISLIALIILFIPFIIIGIVIKLESKGPVFFKQERIGKNKTRFKIYKFRTMRTDAPKDMPTHMLNDASSFITKSGNLFRKTSIDELPQLINILKGEMSIVGPRPALWNQDDLVAERDKYGANDITPGLTGWAQVNGRDELEIPVKAKLDGEYVKKITFLNDLKIIGLTVVKAIKGDGIVEGKHESNIDNKKDEIKKDDFKFSVLMSVYKNDKTEFVKEAIDSIINQTLKPNEIVITVDGLVPENIENLIKEYDKNFDYFKPIFLKENVGLGNALKIGLKECSYELIARMDSDDISNPDRFEKQINEFKNNKDLSIVGGNISEFIEDINKSVGIRRVPQNEEEISKYIKSRNPFNHVTVMFKKQSVIEAGSYQDFFCYEDYYLWVRMFLKNMKMKNIDSILVNVRVGEDMYKRRGGWKYYKSGVNFQKYLRKSKLISIPKYCYNVIIRFVLQVLMPNSLRSFVYQKFARNKQK